MPVPPDHDDNADIGKERACVAEIAFIRQVFVRPKLLRFVITTVKQCREPRSDGTQSSVQSNRNGDSYGHVRCNAVKARKISLFTVI